MSNGRPWSDEDKTNAKAMRARGATFREVGIALGRPQTAVVHAFKDWRRADATHGMSSVKPDAEHAAISPEGAAVIRRASLQFAIDGQRVLGVRA